MSVNKVILIGNLGMDPEIREMPGGGKVANFNLATSSRWRDKQTGEKREETEWHRIKCFGGLATVVGSYLHKGSKVYLEGRIKTRSFDGKDGSKVYVTEVVCDDLQMLDGRKQPSAHEEVEF